MKLTLKNYRKNKILEWTEEMSDHAIKLFVLNKMIKVFNVAADIYISLVFI